MRAVDDAKAVVVTRGLLTTQRSPQIRQSNSCWRDGWSQNEWYAAQTRENLLSVGPELLERNGCEKVLLRQTTDIVRTWSDAWGLKPPLARFLSRPVARSRYGLKFPAYNTTTVGFWRQVARICISTLRWGQVRFRLGAGPFDLRDFRCPPYHLGCRVCVNYQPSWCTRCLWSSCAGGGNHLRAHHLLDLVEATVQLCQSVAHASCRYSELRSFGVVQGEGQLLSASVTSRSTHDVIIWGCRPWCGGCCW